MAVRVAVIGPDSAIAAAIGATDGVLPGAEVTLEEVGGGEEPQTKVTDAAGMARFDRLLPTLHRISAVRLLDSAESARLSPDDRDVNAFGGGAQVRVTAPSTEATMRAIAARRGSLVISELFTASVTAPGGGDYTVGTYMELYNNSDSTIYLDGKVVARGMSHVLDYSSNPCSKFERWRNDPDGIWVRYFYGFPGSGRSYPVSPGEAVVVATDAIDHSEFVPGLPDLRGADFEFIGPSDVNNPSVPDMINIGPGEWAAAYPGHGLTFHVAFIAFVADSLTVESLPQDNLPLRNPEYRRIPAEKILDVFTSDYSPEGRGSTTPPACPQMVHENFDRQFAALLEFYTLRAGVRELLAGFAADLGILRRTKTSAIDFRARNGANPGSVP